MGIVVKFNLNKYPTPIIKAPFRGFIDSKNT